MRFKWKHSSLEYSFIAARNFQVIIAFYCIIRLNITIWQYIRISNENFFAQRNFGAKTVIFDSSWFTDVHLVKEKYKLSKQYTVSIFLGILWLYQQIISVWRITLHKVCIQSSGNICWQIWNSTSIRMHIIRIRVKYFRQAWNIIIIPI